MHAPTLADDPHQPWDARLQLLPESGVGWVTGVPFWNERQQEQPQEQPQGIVVYMSTAAAKGNNDAVSKSNNQAQFLQATAAVACACAYNNKNNTNNKKLESPSKLMQLINDSRAIQESTNKNTVNVSMELTTTRYKTSWMHILWHNDNDCNDMTTTTPIALKTRPPDWIHAAYALAGAIVFLICMSLAVNLNLNMNLGEGALEP
jgi:hypothetical protein